MSSKIQIRRGIKASLPALSSGEPGLATDTHELFVGTPDGNLAVNGDNRNALFNGNFDVWQRGTSFTTDGYTADRWWSLHDAGGGVLPSITRSKQSLTSGDISEASTFYRISSNGVGSALGAASFGILRQLIENGTRYLCGAGKKVTVSFWARSSISGKRIAVFATQNYGSGGSPSSGENLVGTTWTVTSTWQKFTYTFTTNTLVGKIFGTNSDDSLQIDLYYVWGSSRAANFGAGTAETFVGAGDIDIAQVQVCAGDVALPFQLRSFAEELLLCQRYYYKTFPYGTTPAQASGLTTGGLAYRATVSGVATNGVMVRYPVPMRTTPTLTFYSPTSSNNKWRNGNTSADSGIPSVTISGEKSSFIDNPQVVGDNVGDFLAVHLTADADL